MTEAPKKLPWKRKKKFRKAERLFYLTDLIEWIDIDGWIYWCDKPLHPGWVQSMTVRTLKNALEKGIIYRAREEV
jgi:hypothetical protein